MSNTAKSPTNAGSNWWNVATFGPDSEVYCDVPTLISGSATLKTLYLRLQSPGTSGVDGYRMNVKESDSSWIIARIDDGASTQLGASATQAPAAGDAWGFEAIGSTLAGYRKPSAGSWTQILSRTDSTYGSAGNIGLRNGADATTTFDTFSGGTVVAAATRVKDPIYAGFVPTRR